MNHPPDSERAVSEIFGAMVLIGVIVTGIAIIGVMMFSQPQPQKIPDLNALISSNAQTVQIQHNGGDSFLKSEVQIRLDGQDKTSSFTIDGTNTWSTWSIGQSLTYDIPSGSPVPSLIQIVYTGGGISQLIASSGEGSTAGLSVQAPVVDSITPNSGNVGDTVHITNLVGASFFSGATVKLSRAGYSDIPATNVVVVSSTQITCDISLPGATATKGAWDVVVTNPGGPSGTLSNGFTVLVPPPTITGISPSFGIRASGAKVNITGTNLTGATSVTFGTGNFATIVTNTATTINMTAPAGSGTVTVTVNTPGGTATTSYNYFIIQIFTSSQSWTGPTGMVGIDYLVVGGGGGGGGFSGGGGGAGAVWTGTLTTGLTGAKTVTIGPGGAAGTNNRGTTGSNSVFATITATGGGGGASSANTAGRNGGSGGGAVGTGAVGTGVASHGFAGGTGKTWSSGGTQYLGGGGGGMGAVGGTATGSAVPYAAGIGGVGTDYSGTFGPGFGESGFVAGGGGGGGSNNGGSTFGVGGNGGGGDGSVTGAGQAGTPNTGGGGGGGSPTSGGGLGGSGLVVISYY